MPLKIKQTLQILLLRFKPVKKSDTFRLILKPFAYSLVALFIPKRNFLQNFYRMQYRNVCLFVQWLKIENVLFYGNTLDLLSNVKLSSYATYFSSGWKDCQGEQVKEISMSENLKQIVFSKLVFNRYSKQNTWSNKCKEIILKYKK